MGTVNPTVNVDPTVKEYNEWADFQCVSGVSITNNHSTVVPKAVVKCSCKEVYTWTGLGR